MDLVWAELHLRIYCVSFCKHDLSFLNKWKRKTVSFLEHCFKQMTMFKVNYPSGLGSFFFFSFFNLHVGEGGEARLTPSHIKGGSYSQRISVFLVKGWRVFVLHSKPPKQEDRKSLRSKQGAWPQRTLKCLLPILQILPH